MPKFGVPSVSAGNQQDLPSRRLVLVALIVTPRHLGDNRGGRATRGFSRTSLIVRWLSMRSILPRTQPPWRRHLFPKLLSKRSIPGNSLRYCDLRRQCSLVGIVPVAAVVVYTLMTPIFGCVPWFLSCGRAGCPAFSLFTTTLTNDVVHAEARLLSLSILRYRLQDSRQSQSTAR